jgi:hypothetical protein
LKKNGYIEKYLRSDYGKMTREDYKGRFLSEYEAIEKIKELLGRKPKK